MSSGTIFNSNNLSNSKYCRNYSVSTAPICIPKSMQNNINQYEYDTDYDTEYDTGTCSTSTINFNNNIYVNKEYSLKENKFDPLKFSPPKDFMIKLHMRMKYYTSTSLGINDINRNSE